MASKTENYQVNGTVSFGEEIECFVVADIWKRRSDREEDGLEEEYLQNYTFLVLLCWCASNSVHSG